MATQSKLPWRVDEMRWYHQIPSYSYLRWWEDGQGRSTDEANKFLIRGSSGKGARRPSLQFEPMTWEICRRHPNLRKLRFEFDKMIPRDQWNNGGSPGDESLSSQSRKIFAQYGDFGFFLKSLLGYGHLDWTQLDSDLRTRIQINVSHLASALGYPASLPVRDVLSSNLNFQLIDKELDGAAFPEEKTVVELINDAHGQGRRLMVLDVNPLSSESEIAQEFARIFRQSYGRAAIESKETIRKNEVLGISVPRLSLPHKQYREAHLHFLVSLDREDALSYEDRRNLCNLFKGFVFLR